MTDEHDAKLRQLMHELADAAPVAPAFDATGEVEVEASVRARPLPVATSSRRRVAIAGAAMVAVLGVATIVVISVASSRERTPASGPTPGAEDTTGTAGTASTSPSSTVPSPAAPTSSSSAAPTSSSTSSSSTSSTSVPVGAGVVADLAPIGVTFRNLPPTLPLEPWATVPLSDGAGAGIPPIALLDDGRAVVVDPSAGEAVVVDEAGNQVHVDLGLDVALPYPGGSAVAPYFVTGGPGAVLYGIVSALTAPPVDQSLGTFVAISLDGANLGALVSATPFSRVALVEQPTTILGHDDAAVIQRANGTPIVPYVDTTGQPLPSGIDAPSYLLGADGFVRSTSGAAHWLLSIERDPGYTGGYVSDPPPMPLPGGAALVSTALGPPMDPSADVSDPTVPVVAVLQPDGSGSWYRLVDGWAPVAVDVWGAVFARPVDGGVELAHMRVPAVAARVCGVGDVAATSRFGDSAMSNVKNVVRLTNVSSTPCSLTDGPIGVSGVAPDGTVVPFDVTSGTYFPDPIPSDRPLAPGEHAVFWIASGSEGACAPEGGADRWEEVQIEVPGVGPMRVPVAALVTGGPYGTCDVGVSTIGVDPVP